ncbi:MAG: MFS transporter [Deltaproteobacteria bacterium]|nr:MFS transporter [Deltaproteobacteria bacterium]MBW2360243.1 MFS transporter [Deltaproteobacteria bacterium]
MANPESPSETAPPSNARSKAVLLIVFTTILIDFIGFTVLIPVLPLYAEQLGASAFQVALILTVYALAQLVFLPVWGWVSDRIGRRPVILVSLFGTVASFLVLAFADTLGVIYLSRALAGFFAASIGTAQAVVTDVTPPSERAGGMGIIGAAFGAGMVLGPALGGFAASYNVKAPFYAVAVLAALNFVLAWWRLPESRPAGLRQPSMAELRRAFIPTPIRLVVAVHDRRIALFLYLFFHLFTAFAVLEALFTLYAAQQFGRTALDVGFLFMWIGVVLFITQGLFLRRMVGQVGEPRLIGVGLTTMGVGLAMVAWAPTFGWCYVVGTLIAFGNGITFPAFTSLYSKACEAENAGELLGQSQAMATTGRIVGPMLGGVLMDFWSPGTPFLIAGAMMLGALLMFRLFRGLLLGDKAPLPPKSAENPATPG